MRWMMLLRTTLLMYSLLGFNSSGSVNALASKLHDGVKTQPSRGPHNNPNSNIPLSDLILHRRSIKTANALGPGWTGHVIPSAAVYPAAIGAQIFGKFYGGIAHYASSEWTATALTNSYVISIGTIKLFIWSLDPEVQIAWDFVRSFADRMLAETQRGFVGVIDASFVHLVSEIMVHVKLIIVGRAGY
ncbi:MAG: hypothetical protein Q9172_001819 [Xanthocarpia lactea]